MSEVKSVEVKILKKILLKYQGDIFDANREMDKHKLGKVLTIIDGAIADETQRKAVKDLVHDAWYRPSEALVGSPYPQMSDVTSALGFQLYSDPVAVETATRYNPYSEIVK